ncbi:CD209 antigen-like protein C [Aulostomus maculatus]
MTFDSFPVEKYCPEKECQPCQSGWTLHQGKCYFFSGARKSWYESRQYCKDSAAVLVVIDSLQEQEFLGNHSDYSRDGFWIDGDTKKDFCSVDGLNDASEWKQPCVLLVHDEDATACWKPAKCWRWNKFICENSAIKWTN